MRERTGPRAPPPGRPGLERTCSPIPPARGHGPRQGGVSPTKYSRRAPAARREPSYLYRNRSCSPRVARRRGAQMSRGSRGRVTRVRGRGGVRLAPRGPQWGPPGGGLICARGAPGPGGRKAKRGPQGRSHAGCRLSARATRRVPVPEPRKHPGSAYLLPLGRCASLLACRARCRGRLRPFARHFPSVRHRRLAPPCMDPAGGAPQCSPTARTPARVVPSRPISPAPPRPQTGPPASPSPGAGLGAQARSPLPPLHVPLCARSLPSAWA